MADNKIYGFKDNGTKVEVATKADLDNIEIPDATTVVDNLNSTSTTEALSAKQGKVLNDKTEALETTIETGKFNIAVDPTDTTGMNIWIKTS